MPAKEKIKTGVVYNSLHHLNTHSKKVIVVVGIASLTALSAALGGWLFYTNNYQGVVATVGGKKITNIDLNKEVYGLNFSGTQDSPADVDPKIREQLLDRLIERVVIEKEAEAMGISVSDDEVAKEISIRLGNQFNDYNEPQKAQTRETVRSSILIEKVKEKVVGTVTGKVIVVRFDEAYQDTIPNAEAEYQKDKVYAKNLADDLYNKIKNKQISFDEAMKIADADKTVGMPAWVAPQNYPFSKSFTKDNPIYSSGDYYGSTDFTTKVFSQKRGLNEPQVATMLFEEMGDKTMEGFYFISDLDSLQGGAKTYEEWLEQKKVEYKARKM